MLNTPPGGVGKGPGPGGQGWAVEPTQEVQEAFHLPSAAVAPGRHRTLRLVDKDLVTQGAAWPPCPGLSPGSLGSSFLRGAWGGNGFCLPGVRDLITCLWLAEPGASASWPGAGHVSQAGQVGPGSCTIPQQGGGRHGTLR